MSTIDKGTTKQPDGVGVLGQYKKLLSYLFILLLVAQLFLFGRVQDLGSKMLQSAVEADRLQAELAETFITDTIRAQQRMMLGEMKQEWMQYIISHPETELLLKDDLGRHIFVDEAGKKIPFDPSTMKKKERPDNSFDLISLSTGQTIASRARLQWDLDAVRVVLNIISSPARAFGPSGDVMVYDSYTGEVILNTSKDNANTAEVFASDGRRYISLESKHPGNQNPLATERNYSQVLMWVRDSDRYTGLIDYFNEPTDMGTDGNDFEKYPFGEYNRSFVEKVILPCESVGVDGQQMHLSVLLSASEQEIFQAYSSVYGRMEALEERLDRDILKVGYVPTMSVLLSLATICLAMFAVKLYLIACKKFIRSPGGQS